jgi:hypothetical protein
MTWRKASEVIIIQPSIVRGIILKRILMNYGKSVKTTEREVRIQIK